WSGKLLDKAGRKEERDAQWQQLIAKYPYGYFSYRVDVILSRADGEGSGGTGPSASSRLRMTAPVPGQPFPTLDLTLPDTVRELAAVGLMRDASREMKRI